MTDRELLKMALEALEYYRSGEDCQPTPASKTIPTLRQALNVDAFDTSSTYVDKNEKRKHEPVAYACKDDVILAKHWTSDQPPSGWVSLYTAPISEPVSKQEPVAWKCCPPGKCAYRQVHKNAACPEEGLKAGKNKAPPSKPWVSLTDDEIDDIASESGFGYINVARAVEAALKEKNNG